MLSEPQRRGDFSGGAVIRDPLTGQPFPGNVIPTDRISPISQRILEQYIPLPNSTLNRSVRSPNVEDNRQQFGTRVDYQLNPKHTLLGRYMIGHTKNVNPLGGSNFSPAGNTAVATLQDVMGSDTWMIRPTMINVARASMNRIGAKPTVTSGLDLRDLGFQMTPSNATAPGLPFITLTGFFTTGDAQQPFATRTNNVFGVTDDLTWVAGRHSMKFGGELRRDQIRCRSSTGRTAISPSAARSTPAIRSLISCSVSRIRTRRRPGIRTSTARRGSMRSTARTNIASLA